MQTFRVLGIAVVREICGRRAGQNIQYVSLSGYENILSEILDVCLVFIFLVLKVSMNLKKTTLFGVVFLFQNSSSPSY